MKITRQLIPALLMTLPLVHADDTPLMNDLLAKAAKGDAQGGPGWNTNLTTVAYEHCAAKRAAGGWGWSLLETSAAESRLC